jgi:hypothetical protein
MPPTTAAARRTSQGRTSLVHNRHSDSWNNRVHQVGPARTSTATPNYILAAYMASGT